MSAAKRRGVVGIVGLGIMGGSFAKNLVADGWRVIGYDIDPARRRALAKAGVEIAADMKQLAAIAPTIITSLPSPQALAATVDAIVGARLRPLVVVDASTFALADKVKAERSLHGAGHVMLDCPISGTGAQARHRDIVIYASGDPKAIKRLRSLFAGFARAAHDLGAFGNGSRMKYVANLLVAINNVATAEAMVLGMKSGLDPQTIFDLLPDRRRQFPRVRAACAHDGAQPLRQRHHEDRGLEKGREGDRRFRPRAGLPDAAVRGDPAGLCGRARGWPRHGRHGLGLRRARSQGRSKAAKHEDKRALYGPEIGRAVQPGCPTTISRISQVAKVATIGSSYIGGTPWH